MYYWGPENHNVRSYNYQGGIHLATQRQKICVRREVGICKLCWTPTTAIDFQLSDSDDDDNNTGVRPCCQVDAFG